MQSDVAIVGGGLAGLACAVALSTRGLQVQLFESSERLGGRACSWIDRQSGDQVCVCSQMKITIGRPAGLKASVLGDRLAR